MSRCRKISTDISVEAKLNRVSLLATLLYSWGIPHARDDCRLPKKDPEELRLMMIPGRPHGAEDVAAALAELVEAQLMGIDDDGFYFFPHEIFYKYQSYVGVKNRRETPSLKKFNKITPPAENSGNVRKTAEMCVSPSPSPSLSRGAATAPPLRARETIVNDLGLGDKHPAALCGWELWDRLERFWHSQGKKMTIFQVEMAFKLLSDAKHKGHDPTQIVEKTLRAGWMDLYEPEKEPKKAIALPAKPAAVKAPQPKPSAEEIAKAKQFLAEIIGPLAERKAMPAPNLDERRAMLRRQAAQLRGGP
jgi:hypothetical protein